MYAKHLSSVSNCFVTSMSFISLPSHEPRNQHYADKKDNQEQNAVFLLHGRQVTPKSCLCQVHNHRYGLFATFCSLLSLFSSTYKLFVAKQGWVEVAWQFFFNPKRPAPKR